MKGWVQDEEDANPMHLLRHPRGEICVVDGCLTRNDSGNVMFLSVNSILVVDDRQVMRTISCKII